MKPTLMTACQIHAIAEFALMGTIHSLVNVTLDLLDICARHKSTNANLIRANMEVIVKILSEVIAVVVYLEHQVSTVRST